MASSNRCSVCSKGRGTCYCPGCKAFFCDKDFKHHREILFNGLDELTVDRNDLQEKINKASSNKQSGGSLLSRIDQWQQNTIEKVKQAAEQARQQVLKIMNSKREAITGQFQTLSQELEQLRETEGVLEQDLARLKQQIGQLNKDLEQLSQPPAVELNMNQSDQIVWHRMIYVEERSAYAGQQQRQSQAMEALYETKKAALNTALDERTDSIKLRQCIVDLRSHSLCADSWWESRILPQLYAITISYQGKIFNIYINEYVQVGVIFARLANVAVINKDTVFFGYLTSLHNQFTFEIYDTINTQLNNSQLTLHIRDPPPAAIMTIFVRTLTGTLFMISSLRDDSLEMFKSKVYFVYGVPSDEQRIIFAGKQLEDGRTLSHYNIQKDSTVHLILRLKGGKPIIRLHSCNNQVIYNVTVRLDLASNVWNVSSVYPIPSNTDQMSFVEWNNIHVHPNGQLSFKKRHSIDHPGRFFPSIVDEYEYRMLFWEALTNNDSSFFSLDKGLCVPRQDFSRVLNYLLKRMSFSSEDRDDMITYVLPHLDEADPDCERKSIVFRFLSQDEYSTVAPLNVRPLPERIVRAFLLYRFGEDDEQVSNINEIDQMVTLVTKEYSSSSGLIVHEWGSMFVH